MREQGHDGVVVRRVEDKLHLLLAALLRDRSQALLERLDDVRGQEAGRRTAELELLGVVVALELDALANVGDFLHELLVVHGEAQALGVRQHVHLERALDLNLLVDGRDAGEARDDGLGRVDALVLGHLPELGEERLDFGPALGQQLGEQGAVLGRLVLAD